MKNPWEDQEKRSARVSARRDLRAAALRFFPALRRVNVDGDRHRPRRETQLAWPVGKHLAGNARHEDLRSPLAHQERLIRGDGSACNPAEQRRDGVGNDVAQATPAPADTDRRQAQHRIGDIGEGGKRLGP